MGYLIPTDIEPIVDSDTGGRRIAMRNEKGEIVPVAVSAEFLQDIESPPDDLDVRVRSYRSMIEGIASEKYARGDVNDGVVRVGVSDLPSQQQS